MEGKKLIYQIRTPCVRGIHIERIGGYIPSILFKYDGHAVRLWLKTIYREKSAAPIVVEKFL